MADCIWLGTISTNPTVGANWSTAAVPAAADDVIFDGSASANCAGGDLTANQIGSVTVTADCVINIGTSLQTPLYLDCNGPVLDSGQGIRHWRIKNTTTWQNYGTGECHINGIDNDGLLIDAPGASIYVGTDPAEPAEFDTTVAIRAGTVEIVYLTDQLAAATDLDVAGGIIITRDALDRVEVYAGTWIHHGMVSPTFTFDPADVTVVADTITEAGHLLTTGMPLTVSTTNTLPAPLAAATTYYAIFVDINTFQLSATVGGAAIDLTTQGVGVHTISPQAIGSIYVHAGTADYRSTGAITAAYVYDGGILTFANNVTGCTVTNCTVEGSGSVLDPGGVVTWTNAVPVNGESISSGLVDFGKHKKYTVVDI